MTTDDFVERLTAASTEAKSVLHEIYAATKDMRKVIKESEVERAAWTEVIKTANNEEIVAVLTPQLASMQDEIKIAMDRSVVKVNKEFEALSNILLSGHKSGIPQDSGKRLDELVMKVKGHKDPEGLL